MERETGGQAFPRQQWEYDGQNNVLQYQEEGMTLLDYFAAKAMPTLLADGHLARHGCGAVAEHAYLMANQMLIARAAISKATGE